jgi:NADPH:quinone reductase-like Zn-dependent oxidoreductase
MAIQIAKRLGAGRVIGAGRDYPRLSALAAAGADDTVQLTDDTQATGNALAVAAAEVDIVIDYLWGLPAQQAIMALLTARSDRGQALNWIQIGAQAGPTIELPSVALRSANFRLQGVRQGAVPTADYLAELPSLVSEITSGAIRVAPCRWLT